MQRIPAVAILLSLGLLPGAVAWAQKAEGPPVSLTVIFTNNGEPLHDPLHGKFYVYEPGKRERYLGWGHAFKSVRVPPGDYDIVIRYGNDTIVEERVLEEYEVTADTVLEEEAAFEIPVASLTLDIVAGGAPIPVYSGSFNVHRAGRRGEPLVSRRPGETVTIRPGLYDIEVIYRDPLGLKSTWLTGYQLDGERYEAVSIGVALARLRITLLEDGRELSPSQGRWRVQEPGRRRAAAEGRSGEARDIPAGIYDVGLFFQVGPARGERWMRGMEIGADEQLRVEVGSNVTTLRIDVQRRGNRVRGAWYSVFQEGRRDKPLLTARSGAEIELAPGVYDIRASFRDGGIRAERWLRGQRVERRTELDVELEIDPATLRVMPPRRVRGLRTEANVLVLLDSSLEMGAPMGSRSRLELARDALGDAAAMLRGGDLRLGLRVYGIAPRGQENCQDSTLILPLGPFDARRFDSTLDLLRPAGHSPIAYSLQSAESDLPADGRNTIVLVTGSTESCGGDPCAAASRILWRGRIERLYVVALDTEPETQPQLDCIGAYRRVTTRSQLRGAFRDILRDTAAEDEGSVSVFLPGSGAWVATGRLGQTLRLSSGSYDIRVRAGRRTWTWESFRVTGNTETIAGPRP